MSNFSTFFPGSGGGGGGAIGDYGVKPMAYGTDTFTDPNDDSVWFKTGYISTDLAAYPKFTPGLGIAGKYPQLTQTGAFVNNGTRQGDVQYNSQEDKIIVRQLNSYPTGNYGNSYYLDPANIPGGNWGNTSAQGDAASSTYSFEPVGDGIGNNYVLRTNQANNSTLTGSQSQTRTSNWLQQSLLKIGKVSGGSRTSGYTFNQTINITGIPTGTSASNYKQYHTPLSLVATENHFYYSFLQKNPNINNYLTYYYNQTIFVNYEGNLTMQDGQQPQPATPSRVFARIRCVKLSKTGAFESEFTRPFSDQSGGGSALLVFTDPLSTGDSFYTLDKNSIQNSIGPQAGNYAGFPVRSDLVDFNKTYTIRKHSEDGTVIKELGGLPITSITQTARATTISQQAFCTPNGDVHYFTAAAFAGSAAQTTQSDPNSPLFTTFNIFKLGDVIGDSQPRFTSIPSSMNMTQTGMGINTSNAQIMSGPSQASYSPTPLYIRVA